MLAKWKVWEEDGTMAKLLLWLICCLGFLFCGVMMFGAVLAMIGLFITTGPVLMPLAIGITIVLLILAAK